MTPFIEAAEALIAQSSDAERRMKLWRHFINVGLPTTDDEVWRYAPLSTFDLDAYALSLGATSTPADVPAGITDGAAVVVRSINGSELAVSGEAAGVRIETALIGESFSDVTPETRYGSDAFALMCLALSPAPIVVRVAKGVEVTGPIVVIHDVNARAAFPAIRVEVGDGARVEIVEVLVGGVDALASVVGEYDVGVEARLSVSSVQRLDASAWHVSRTTVRLNRDAFVNQSVVGLGANYDRCRNDAELAGSGARNELRTTYFGFGDQVHDFRTHQFHEVPRTTSMLLSKGVVADRSRSIYTGLIEIERGAKKTDARQTNHNLILSPSAHADTVPNLDIRENDVMCAHASSVGPLDDVQLWYLESRGIEPAAAKQLLVKGFFREMTAMMPPAVATAVDDDVAQVLAASSAT